MGVTTHFSFRYPELTDTPDGATQMQNLASDVDAALNIFESAFTFADYTPVWTGLSSLGTSTSTGRYIKAGKLVVFTAKLVAAGTTSLGTGNIAASLPVTAASGNGEWTGSGQLYPHDGTSNTILGFSIFSGATTAALYAIGVSGSTVPNPAVNHAVGYWSPNWVGGSTHSWITVTGMYEAA